MARTNHRHHCGLARVFPTSSGDDIIPVTFNGCFGWLHPATGSRGVVMCGPHGYEEQSTHRIWRRQAANFAAAGLPTLRFDYHGTGDSEGDDADPGRVEAWQNSLRAAVRFLRDHTGVEEVALVGLRLGALLAATVAPEIEGLESLALLACPSSGKVYLRQMHVLARMAPPIADAPPTPPEWQDDLEMGGSLLTAESMAALERLNLMDMNCRPAKRVLLFNRPDLPPDRALPAKMTELGAELATETLTGYREMMRPAPHLAETPQLALTFLTDWVRGGMASSHSPLRPPPTPARIALPTPARIALPTASEVPVAFGHNGKLFGIQCTPANFDGGRQRPVLLFLNSGANNHIGTNRLSVTLARHLAMNGFSSLRMDVAGIGDSDALPGQPDNVMDSKASRHDVQAALDLLEGQGYRQCVVVGLCSGAHLGFGSALLDRRITGMVLINPQKFTLDDMELGGLAGQFQRLWRIVAYGGVKWPSYVPAFLRQQAKAVGAYLADKRTRWLARDGEQNDTARSFRRLADRDVDILLIYAAQDPGLDVLTLFLGSPETIEQRFCNLKLQIINGIDHTLTKRWAREHVARLVETHLLPLASPSPLPEPNATPVNLGAALSGQ